MLEHVDSLLVSCLLLGCCCCSVGSGVSQEQVRLVDDQTFETVDVLPLHHYEMACSCASLTLADDPNPYYVVGTAYAIPDEQEPTKVSASHSHLLHVHPNPFYVVGTACTVPDKQNVEFNPYCVVHTASAVPDKQETHQGQRSTLAAFTFTPSCPDTCDIRDWPYKL